MEDKKKIKILKKIKNNELSGIENIEIDDFVFFLDFCIENDYVSGIRYEKNKYFKIFVNNMSLTVTGEKFLKELENNSWKN